MNFNIYNQLIFSELQEWDWIHYSTWRTREYTINNIITYDLSLKSYSNNRSTYFYGFFYKITGEYYNEIRTAIDNDRVYRKIYGGQ